MLLVEMIAGSKNVSLFRVKLVLMANQAFRAFLAKRASLESLASLVKVDRVVKSVCPVQLALEVDYYISCMQP